MRPRELIVFVTQADIQVRRTEDGFTIYTGPSEEQELGWIQRYLTAREQSYCVVRLEG